MTKHAAATVYITALVDKTVKILLHKHRKLNKCYQSKDMTLEKNIGFKALFGIKLFQHVVTVIKYMISSIDN